MFYTYILRSLSHPEQHYIGSTADLQARLAKHNAGEVYIQVQAVAYSSYPRFFSSDIFTNFRTITIIYEHK